MSHKLCFYCKKLKFVIQNIPPNDLKRIQIDDLAMICFEKLESVRKILFYNQGIHAIITFQFGNKSLIGQEDASRRGNDLFSKTGKFEKDSFYSQGIRAIITFQFRTNSLAGGDRIGRCIMMIWQ